jgi:acyl-CoA thioesterase II
VDARAWLGLEPTHNPMRWTLPVTPGISTGHQFLFGGCGLGAAIEALEGTTGRPLVWATAQYLSYANPPEVLDIDVTVAVAGNQVTQARAVGHVADREVLTVNAALGTRDLEAEGQWATPPEVPPPDECPARQLRFPGDDSIMARLDIRLASAHAMEDLPGPGMPGGRSALWARLPGQRARRAGPGTATTGELDGDGSAAQAQGDDVLDPSAAALAILGDYVPFGIGQALGERAGGNSLDNTLRVARLVPTEWVLIDIRIDAVANGFGHGVVHLWAEDGTLLATASQSTIVRFWRE